MEVKKEDEKEAEVKPTPMCSDAPVGLYKPELNFSDFMLIRTCIELVQENLIPELQERAKLIIDKLLEAEEKIKGKE